MATLKLRVTGMTCPHCQMKVEKAQIKLRREEAVWRR